MIMILMNASQPHARMEDRVLIKRLYSSVYVITASWAM